MQTKPYVIIEHVGRNITHIDGYIHQILMWMAEKCNFTYITKFFFTTSILCNIYYLRSHILLKEIIDVNITIIIHIAVLNMCWNRTVRTELL